MKTKHHQVIETESQAIRQLLEVDQIAELPIPSIAKKYYRIKGRQNMHKLPGQYIKMIKKLTNQPSDQFAVSTVGKQLDVPASRSRG